jgi:hypothetical protein
MFPRWLSLQTLKIPPKKLKKNDEESKYPSNQSCNFQKKKKREKRIHRSKFNHPVQ